MERTLTARELNRALLARQGLLERRERSIPDVLDAMGTLQAQYAPSMYIGLWSRVAGFERDALTRALEDRDGHPGDADAGHDPPRARARTTGRWRSPIRAARRAWWLRATQGPERAGDGRRGARRCAPRSKDGPLKRKAIDELLGKPVAHGIGLWVDMVRVPPSGTWERRRADLYGLAEDWVGAARRRRRRRARPPRHAAT